jgi:sugar lactone lactonase YvrE
MKNTLVQRPLVLVASALVWSALNLHAQTAPTITTQPVSQTNLVGTTASFSVAVSGTGPFTYQWQFNGTNLPNNIITTVAGKSTSGFSGDGGAATNASLNHASGVAFDASGNLYIADEANYRIRKVTTNGIITTVAGNGISGYSGDGGAATNASLCNPPRMTFDSSRNLYIDDQCNNRIRKVDANGTITTVVGNGTAAYAGDGGLAFNASLSNPDGIAFDAFGNLFIADTYNHRIRKVDANGIITTVAAIGESFGVAFDASGNLYFSDYVSGLIRKVNTNGIITTVAGNGISGYSGDGGAATNASLDYPQGFAFDAVGNLYIADTINYRIRKVDINGIITTVAGNGISGYSGDGGAANNAGVGYPISVAFDVSGNLYIADYGDSRIREVHFAGYPTLTLSNIGTSNAGNYSVVITSPYGSVTSSVVTLSIPAYIISQP